MPGLIHGQPIDETYICLYELRIHGIGVYPLSTGGARTLALVAAQTSDWGDPVLLSAISTLGNGRLWYRGRDAVELANTASFEEITGPLWETDAVCIKPSTTRVAQRVERAPP